jgi:hypothetical protein
MRGKINRDLELEWMENVVKEGTEVHRYEGYDYGVISEGGIAVSEVGPQATPFFQVPADSVDWEN